MYNEYNRYAIGFDNIFNELNRLQRGNAYPPHNIVKISDDKYIMEFAIAGFNKEEISIHQEDGFLVILGECTDDEREYLHKGISSRNFENKFKLADYVEVIDAEMKDGLLVITIERLIPEELRPRQIEIK